MTHSQKDQLVKVLSQKALMESHHFKVVAHHRSNYYPDIESWACDMSLIPEGRYIIFLESIIALIKKVDNTIIIYLSTEDNGCLLLL